MGDPVFKGSMELSQVMREIDRVNKELGKLKEANQATTQAAKGGADSAAGAFGGWATSLGGLIASYASLQTVVRLANNELANTVELRQKAATAAQTENDAQLDFLRNVAPKSAAERDAAIARVKEISSASGVSVKDLYQRMSAITSAKGNLPAEYAWQALQGSARFFPESQEKGTAVGTASLGLMRATKSTNVEAAIGLLSKVSEFSHIADWQKIAENAEPAITSAVGAGASGREAGALYSAMTIGISDWTGRKSRTATAQLTRQLEEYYPEKDTPLYREDPNTGQVYQIGTRKGTGLKTFGERLGRAQSSQEEAMRFYSQASFEEVAKNTVKGLLGIKDRDAKEGMARTYADMVAAIPGEAGLQSHFRQQEEMLKGAGSQSTSQLGRSIASSTERLLADNPALVLAGTLQEKVPGLLQAAGAPDIAKKMRGFAESAMANPEAASMMLADVETEVRRKQRPVDYYRAAGYGAPQPIYREPTEGETKQAEILQAVANDIRKLVELQQQTKDATQTTARKAAVSGSAATNTHTEGR